MSTLPKCTQEVIDTLKAIGVKFNIITPVGHRVELHYEYQRFDGSHHIHFVAELDAYGNLTDTGPYFPEKAKHKEHQYVYNADGVKV